MKYDRYEIKKVEHLKGMSQETECFSLELYVDGKKFAHVGNTGHGGSHSVHPIPPFTWKDVQAVTEDMKKDKFLVNYEFEPFETAVDTIFSMWQIAKTIKSSSKKKAVLLDDGQVYTMGYKNAPPDQNLFASVMKKYPNAVILNNMDIAEAAKLVVIAERAAYEKEFDNAPGGPKV
jgi:hypothetical protein